MTALRGRTRPYGGRSLRVALAWFFSSKPAYAIVFIGGPGRARTSNQTVMSRQVELAA